ncbi:aminomethyltransferase [Microbacterium suwonense]|uniref:Aminomethyltransferase n=1 Tax=Microbacterium suwonense TaxID=683047 RepID=A0ABN6X2X8_9MICO|nr:aminomethyltransferase [Microbacterium suwonense]
MTETRYTPLRARHEALGASFTDFGGWQMPVRYTSDLAEHHAVRQAAGIFDISHMAEFTVRGADAAAYLDYALAGRLSAMTVGKAKYSLLLTDGGGIVDDVIVYRLADDDFLIISNAGNRDAVREALAARTEGMDVDVVDVSDAYALIAVQGPAAERILTETAGIDEISVPWPAQKYYSSASATFAGKPLLLARTGYTGEDGFELLVAAADAEALWDAVLAAGEKHGIVPAGLAARDTLRLEAGMPLYGHELSREIRPAQAGLGRVVAVDKERFVGKDAVAPAEGLACWWGSPPRGAVPAVPATRWWMPMAPPSARSPAAP